MARDLTGLAYVLLTLGVAVVAASAVLLGHWLARRGTLEADKRWHREQTFNLLEKAITRALSTNDRDARVGIAQLEALNASQLLQPEDDDLLYAVTAVILNLDDVLGADEEQLDG